MFYKKLIAGVILIGLTACSLFEPTDTPLPLVETTEPTAQVEEVGMANPASLYCQEMGYRLEIRTAADGSQQGVCIFPDGSECDEWAYYHGECEPASQVSPEPTTEPATTEIPAATEVPVATDTAVPIVTPEEVTVSMDGWLDYIHLGYGFSFRYPPSWTAEEVRDPAHTMREHLIRLIPPAEGDREVELLIGFKRTGDDLLLWPTGVGEGEFVAQGTVDFIGHPLVRNVLVCQDQDMMVFYQQEGGIRRGDVEFSLLLGYRGSCLDGFSLPQQVQAEVDQIVRSFMLVG